MPKIIANFVVVIAFTTYGESYITYTQVWYDVLVGESNL